MSDMQLDYSPQGFGMFVQIGLPDRPYAELRAATEDTKAVVEQLQGELGTPVGHLAGMSNVVEFFWHTELGRESINQALNRIKEEHPGWRISFSDQTKIRW